MLTELRALVSVDLDRKFIEIRKLVTIWECIDRGNRSTKITAQIKSC